MFGFGMPEMIMVAIILGIVAVIVATKKGGSQQANINPAYNNTSEILLPDSSQNARSIGETRNAGAVIVLTLITLGIYYFVWYYKINSEVKLHDPTQNVSPGLAVCALFIPFVNIVSFYNTANRIKLMQKADGSNDFISPGAALLWVLFFGIGYPIYVQGALNNHWHEHAIKTRNSAASARAMDIPEQAKVVVAES